MKHFRQVFPLYTAGKKPKNTIGQGFAQECKRTLPVIKHHTMWYYGNMGNHRKAR